MALLNEKKQFIYVDVPNINARLDLINNIISY